MMKKKEAFISIGFKLVAIVSAILALSLGGLTFLSTMFYGSDIERSVKTSTLERAALLSRDIESDLDGFANAGRVISARIANGERDPSADLGDATTLLERTPGFIAAWSVARADNRFTVRGKAESAQRIASLGVAFPSPEKILIPQGDALTQSFYGEIELVNLSPEFGAPVLALAFPDAMKTESEAETIGLLFLAPDKITEDLAAQELYVNYLVDAAGNLIAHSDGKTALSRPNVKLDPIVRDSLTGKAKLKQMQYASADGKQFIGSYQRFLGGSLTVVSTVEKGTALAGVYRLQQRNLAVTVMILCASMILLFFFSKTLTNPVKALVSGVDRVREGDYAFRLAPSSRDEIGRLTVSFNGMTQGLEERDKIKTAFGKFVNKELAERVLKGDVKLGGEVRTATIFFSDIRSFTALSESMKASEVVDFLNEYMTIMVKCVESHHGVVDKFIGDAIMAIWGVPDRFGNDTENAVNAALAMRAALAEFNARRALSHKPRIRIGCGINTGEVVAGQIGSADRMEYTCIGDPVNLASRIEAANKLFHTDILISEAAQESVHRIFRVEPMKPIRVKGKEEPQQIYAVLGRYDDPRHMRSIEELRAFLGTDGVSLDQVDPEAEETKNEIVE